MHLAALVAVGLAILAVAIVSSNPRSSDSGTTLTVDEDGLVWEDVQIIEADDDDGGATVTASVELEDGAFPAATTREDRFVMFQLGDGRFDGDKHVDDDAAEQLIGLDDDDTVQLYPTSKAGGSMLPAGSGRYAMSLDGSIEYRDIPSGTWTLRAIVVDRTGGWDGEVATRDVRVP